MDAELVSIVSDSEMQSPENRVNSPTDKSPGNENSFEERLEFVLKVDYEVGNAEQNSSSYTDGLSSSRTEHGSRIKNEASESDVELVVKIDEDPSSSFASKEDGASSAENPCKRLSSWMMTTELICKAAKIVKLLATSAVQHYGPRRRNTLVVTWAHLDCSAMFAKSRNGNYLLLSTSNRCFSCQIKNTMVASPIIK